MTVLDEPGALSRICQVFGDAKINIIEVRQPEPPENSRVADLAFTLEPYRVSDFRRVLSRIEELEVCQKIDTHLPLFTSSL